MENTMEKMSYKYSIVPMCKNTSLTAPNKYFFLNVKKNKHISQKWCRIMRRDERKNPPLSEKTSLYCCEEHFNVIFFLFCFLPEVRVVVIVAGLCVSLMPDWSKSRRQTKRNTGVYATRGRWRFASETRLTSDVPE